MHMDMRMTNISLNCVTVLLHILSMITSIYVFLSIIYRWNYNRHHRRPTSIVLASPFDDSISLLLIGNTYFIFIFYSAVWLSVLIYTIAGDFSIFQSFLYLGDSIGCRVRVGLISFLTSAFFHSFLLQALRSFFKVKFHSSLDTKKLCCLSLDHIFTYILLILTSWLISILSIIPAFTIFNAFSYFPQQYHCLISFTNVRGFVYSILSAYVIPVLVIMYIYYRLISFIHHASISNHISSARRELKIVKRILLICIILSLSGSPTIIFLFQFIITGQLHPLVDRIHELCVAININIVTLAFAILSSFNKLFHMRSTIQ